MEKQKFIVVFLFVGACMAFFATGFVYGESSGLITKETLLNELDDPDLIVLDVRTGRDWKSSEFKIKGAVRANPKEFDTWISQQSKDKRYVTYCA